MIEYKESSKSWTLINVSPFPVMCSLSSSKTPVILRVADLQLQKVTAAAFSQRCRERILREGVVYLKVPYDALLVRCRTVGWTNLQK